MGKIAGVIEKVSNMLWALNEDRLKKRIYNYAYQIHRKIRIEEAEHEILDLIEELINDCGTIAWSNQCGFHKNKAGIYFIKDEVLQNLKILRGEQ